jgi:hypothetical protein
MPNLTLERAKRESLDELVEDSLCADGPID